MRLTSLISALMLTLATNIEAQSQTNLLATDSRVGLATAGGVSFPFDRGNDPWRDSTSITR
jgi:hypothetical protein